MDRTAWLTVTPLSRDVATILVSGSAAPGPGDAEAEGAARVGPAVVGEGEHALLALLVPVIHHGQASVILLTARAARGTELSHQRGDIDDCSIQE